MSHRNDAKAIDDNADSTTHTDTNLTQKTAHSKHTDSTKKSHTDKSHRKNTQKKQTKLTENQINILKYIQQNPRITSQKLSEILGLRSDYIRANLVKLKEKGILVRVGADRGGYWKVKKY
jgi:ATP-dependent DNA helicase RecG